MEKEMGQRTKQVTSILSHNNALEPTPPARFAAWWRGSA
jgi:hypothetical protein